MRLDTSSRAVVSSGRRASTWEPARTDTERSFDELLEQLSFDIREALVRHHEVHDLRGDRRADLEGLTAEGEFALHAKRRNGAHEHHGAESHWIRAEPLLDAAICAAPRTVHRSAISARPCSHPWRYIMCTLASAEGVGVLAVRRVRGSC